MCLNLRGEVLSWLQSVGMSYQHLICILYKVPNCIPSCPVKAEMNCQWTAPVHQGRSSLTGRIQIRDGSRCRQFQPSKPWDKRRHAAQFQDRSRSLEYKTVQVFPGRPALDVVNVWQEGGISVGNLTICTIYPAPNGLISHF